MFSKNYSFQKINNKSTQKNLKIDEKISYIQQRNFKKKTEIPISKIFSNQCFTCLPFLQNFNTKIKSANFLNKKNTIFQNHKFSLINNKNQNFFLNMQCINTKMFSKSHFSHRYLPCIERKKFFIKVQPGWFYIIPKATLQYFSDSHQTFFNPGQFLNKNLCFEQNRLFQETILCNSSDFVFEKSFLFKIDSKRKNKNIENMVLYNISNKGFDSKQKYFQFNLFQKIQVVVF